MAEATDDYNNKIAIKKDEVAVEEMKPWEQHSTVISIPRYDYKAPNSFLNRSFSGFLITCPIKREKSATKEAMSILDKCLRSTNTCSTKEEEDHQNVAPKRRKVVISKLEEESDNDLGNKNLDENTSAKEVPEGSPKSDANTERSDPLSLVKLTRSGLILLTFSGTHCPDVVDIVSNIMQSLESGSIKAPLWCHRILPIQTTCVLHEKELCIRVSKLVADFMNNEGKELARPIKVQLLYYWLHLEPRPEGNTLRCNFMFYNFYLLNQLDNLLHEFIPSLMLADKILDFQQ